MDNYFIHIVNNIHVFCSYSTGAMLNTGVIIGICMVLLLTVIIIFASIFLAYHRQKVRRERRYPRMSANIDPSLYYDPTEDDFRIHGISPDQPPPYNVIMDNPAYMGPNTQLPEYSSVPKQPPPYESKIRPKKGGGSGSSKAWEQTLGVNDVPNQRVATIPANSALVGFGAQGIPGGSALYGLRPGAENNSNRQPTGVTELPPSYHVSVISPHSSSSSMPQPNEYSLPPNEYSSPPQSSTLAVRAAIETGPGQRMDEHTQRDDLPSQNINDTAGSEEIVRNQHPESAGNQTEEPSQEQRRKKTRPKKKRKKSTRSSDTNQQSDDASMTTTTMENDASGTVGYRKKGGKMKKKKTPTNSATTNPDAASDDDFGFNNSNAAAKSRSLNNLSSGVDNKTFVNGQGNTNPIIPPQLSSRMNSSFDTRRGEAKGMLSDNSKYGRQNSTGVLNRSYDARMTSQIPSASRGYYDNEIYDNVESTPRADSYRNKNVYASGGESTV